MNISEFAAEATGATLRDEDGEQFDWIELQNAARSPEELVGHYLTDDPQRPTKWQLPEVTIPGGGYLVVFASGKGREPADGGPLHTNFALDRDGEYLALVARDGKTVLSEFGSARKPYPPQRTGVSYGLVGTPPRACYMLHPTPGRANDGSAVADGIVEEVEFGLGRGLHHEPIEVTLRTRTPGAVIRYTTDGSWPSEERGAVCEGAVRIDRTLPLKAIACREGYLPSEVVTHTYVLPESVLRQNSAEVQAVWGFPRMWNGVLPWYGVDRNPRLDPLAHPTLREDLAVVPSLSIAMAMDDLFGAQGIHAHPTKSGREWERRASVEWIDSSDPEGSKDFQQNAAIRIQGGAFRQMGVTRKKSLRVLFKSHYGTGRLATGGRGKLKHPLFGGDATSEFQTLILRAVSGDGWQWRGAKGQAQYARDEFARRAQIALGQPGARGRFCHLYLNGAYWGVYNLVERPDAGFASSYLGVQREDWQGQNSGEPINGVDNTLMWTHMLTKVDNVSSVPNDELSDREFLKVCGYLAGGKREPEYPIWIDAANYADYMLVNWYCGTGDWPHTNYYCGRSRDLTAGGYKFFVWDAEWSLFLRATIEVDRTRDFSGVAAPQRHLERSPEYRMLFADRVHRALFNDGVFVPANALALYQEITKDHHRILNLEAARWGNQHRGEYTVETWKAEHDRITDPETGWFARRPEILLKQLRARRLYPEIEAPTYSQHGGEIANGSGPTFSVPASVTKVYYIYGPGDEDPTDYGHSLDPRLVGGAINLGATLIDFEAEPGSRDAAGRTASAPISLTESGLLLARSYDADTESWSALTEAEFTVRGSPQEQENPAEQTEPERHR